MNKETITQSIARIERRIYSSPYDDLTDYLQGVRDMLNLINGEENNKEIADAVLQSLSQRETAPREQGGK